MKPNYKNWIPKGMIYGFLIATIISLFVMIYVLCCWKLLGLHIIGVSLFIILALGLIWCVFAYNAFSYNGNIQVSKKIILGITDHIELPNGAKGLDVGCGSGALTIACAKKNQNATMVGLDRWGKEYASYNQQLCKNNALAENVANITFIEGNAIHLDFDDETFDMVTSNYVYHNITGHNKQELLSETLRVLKKGGTFAIHDIMSHSRYGDMKKYVEDLEKNGFCEVKLIDTAKGKFISSKMAFLLGLKGSTLLIGRKSI